MVRAGLFCKASLLEERCRIPQGVSQARPARVEEAAELLPCLQLSLLRFKGCLETGTAGCCTLSCSCVQHVRCVQEDLSPLPCFL